MKLSRQDIAVLGLICKEYPVLFDPTDKCVLVMDERPLPTEKTIVSLAKWLTLEQVQAAIKRLLSYQCIAKVLLYDRADVIDQLAAGQTIRRIPNNVKPPTDSFQITAIGKGILDNRLWETGKRFGKKIGGKLVEDYLPLVVSFVFGGLFTSAIGLDLRPIWNMLFSSH